MLSSGPELGRIRDWLTRGNLKCRWPHCKPRRRCDCGEAHRSSSWHHWHACPSQIQSPGKCVPASFLSFNRYKGTLLFGKKQARPQVPGRFLDSRCMNVPTSPYSQWETNRTILRPYAPTDEREFLDLWGDPVVQRLSFVEDLSPTRTAQFLQKTIESTADGSVFFLVVEEKERHEFLGHISLNFKPPSDRDATVGIALKARYRGRGFGTELMHWLITYGFREFGLRRISLTVVQDNIPALRMYKKM